MRVVCVIPARVGSTRLPEKPLQLLAGEPLVRRTAVHVRDMGVAQPVVVATDDARVVAAVSGIPGILPLITSQRPRNGTERVAEVLRRMDLPADVVVNVQGDEPFIPADAVRGALDRVLRGDDIGTAGCPLDSADRDRPEVVKVQIQAGRAAVFQRLGTGSGEWWRHLGVYAYRPDALQRWVRLPPSPDETEHHLEQLRPMAHGMSVGVAIIDQPAPPGIDTRADLDAAEAFMTIELDRVGA